MAVASPVIGSINSDTALAWSDRLGWINFAPDEGNVTVSDGGMIGYAWSQNTGWINLSPDAAGVKNDGEGNLTGLAWGAQIGWIDFSGVTIDRDGWFHGHTRDGVAGTINFDCTQCHLSTDWRPRSTRLASPVSSESSPQGGGSAPPEAYRPPEPPLNGFHLLVNGAASPRSTSSRFVTLTFNAGSDVTRMAIAPSADFVDIPLIAYASSTVWDICSGVSATTAHACVPGVYQIFVKFFTKYGLSASLAPAKIILIAPPSERPVSTSTTTTTLGRSVIPFLKNLRLGMWSPDVKRLQQFLNAAGFPVATSGYGSPGSETAFYGPLTTRAVKALQNTFSAIILRPFGIPSATGLFYEHTRAFVNQWLSAHKP